MLGKRITILKEGLNVMGENLNIRRKDYTLRERFLILRKLHLGNKDKWESFYLVSP